MGAPLLRIYELTQATQGTNTTESYSYDAVGNRLSSLGVSPYSYNTSNELTSTPSGSYTYDYNGNTLTDAGGRSYTWDFENRLTQVTMPSSGGTATFKYDPFGRRIQKLFTQNSTTTTTNYLYDGDNAIESVDQNGAVLAKFAQGQNIDEPLAESVGGASYDYEQDGLGSVSSLTNSTGALSLSYTYDSFGKITNSQGSVANPFRYTGRDFDTETGLYYYRARYFDPSAGRFASEDPLGFTGGVNKYSYAMNMPVDWIDPMGFAPLASQCADLLKDIQRRTDILRQKMDQYDPLKDGLGGWPYKAGGQMHISLPGQHFAQIAGMQARLWIDIAKYQKECGPGGPKIPCDVFKVVNRRVAPTVYPKTLFEIQQEELAARYMEDFWEDILLGDLAVGAGYGAAVLAPVAPSLGPVLAGATP